MYDIVIIVTSCDTDFRLIFFARILILVLFEALSFVAVVFLNLKQGNGPLFCCCLAQHILSYEVLCLPISHWLITVAAGSSKKRTVKNKNC